MSLKTDPFLSRISMLLLVYTCISFYTFLLYFDDKEWQKQPLGRFLYFASKNHFSNNLYFRVCMNLRGPFDPGL